MCYGLGVAMGEWGEFNLCRLQLQAIGYVTLGGEQGQRSQHLSSTRVEQERRILAEGFKQLGKYGILEIHISRTW